MPKNVAAVEGFQVTLTKSLIEQLDLLALTGMYGAHRQAVIEAIVSAEIRRLRSTGEFNDLRGLKHYPAPSRADDDSKQNDE